MFLDADDLVDRELVGFLRSGDSAFVVNQGYRYDAATGALRYQPHFNEFCRSCFSAPFSRDDLPQTWTDRKATLSKFRGHSHYVSIAGSLGMQTAEVPFPAITYVINHTESLEFDRRGRKSLVGDIDPGKASEILRKSFAFTRSVAGR